MHLGDRLRVALNIAVVLSMVAQDQLVLKPSSWSGMTCEGKPPLSEHGYAQGCRHFRIEVTLRLSLRQQFEQSSFLFASSLDNRF